MPSASFRLAPTRAHRSAQRAAAVPLRHRGATLIRHPDFPTGEPPIGAERN
jgi:hypothetical protein